MIYKERLKRALNCLGSKQDSFLLVRGHGHLHKNGGRTLSVHSLLS